MTAIATPFGSSGNKYKFLGSAATINAYPEIRGEGDKARYVLLPCPGLVQFSAVTDTPCRGAIYLEDLDYAISVHSGSAWKITSNGTATRLGTIPGLDAVTICRNKKATPQTVIRCDAGVYVIESEIVQKITDTTIEGCIWVAEQGGYIIYAMPDGRFFISALNEATSIDPLDFATAEQSADKLVAVKALGDGILLLGQYTGEFWRNTGNADFPYEPLGGTTMRKGVLAPASICDFDNSIAWVGLTREGDRYVYRLTGNQPVKISTPEVDRAIAAETSPEDIEGFAHSIDGHAFYTITGENFSFTYDAATQRWHQRESYQQSRWRARWAFHAWNKIIVGDRLSGKLLYLATDTFTEDGEELIWKIRSPTMHSFPNGGICDALRVDFLTGQGVTVSTAQGFEPYLMLRKSLDGGNTFGSERLIETGRQGNYDTRITSRRHGKFGPQGVVWELAMSDPVGRGMSFMDAQVRPLAR